MLDRAGETRKDEVLGMKHNGKMEYIYTCVNERGGGATTEVYDYENLIDLMEAVNLIADNLCITFVTKNSSGNITHSYVIRGERKQK